MSKLKTFRTKHNGLWIAVYLHDFGFGSNLGLSIYKSKRAQNDWYNRRKNRRARRAAQRHGMADRLCLTACARFLNQILKSQKCDIFAYTESDNREVLLRYLKRFGFVETLNGIFVRIQER